MKTIITFLVVAVIVVFVPLFDCIPWWTFLIPLFILGVALPLQKWRVHAFLTAFSAGLCAWLGATVYFEMSYDGQIVEIASGIAELDTWLLYIIIGLIGGVLSGLAFYSGFLLRKGREVLNLDIPSNGGRE